MKVVSILLSIMSNKACHHIHQMKGFFYISFIRLTSIYTLVYQNNKKYQGGGGPFAQCAGPFCPSHRAKGATLRANLFGLQFKNGILETLSESVICIYIART